MLFKRKMTIEKMKSKLNLNHSYNEIIKVGEKYLVLEDTTFDNGRTGQVDVYIPELGLFGGIVKKALTTATYTVTNDTPRVMELNLGDIAPNKIMEHIVKHTETLAGLCTLDGIIVNSKTTNPTRDKIMTKLGYKTIFATGYIKNNPECYIDGNEKELIPALYAQTFGENASERQ